MTRDNLSFYEHESGDKTVSIVGVPMELGSDERGLAKAPQHLLKHGLEKVVISIGAEVGERTIIPCRTPGRVVSAGSAKYIEEITAAARVSCAVVERAVRRGDTVVSLGGDHSISIGTIAGASIALPNKRIGVIWIDAHPDAHTHETTISGNIHGMSAASLMGFGHPFLTRLGGGMRKVSPENFLYIGLKDLDAEEIAYLRRESISRVTMLDIAERGLSRARLAVDALRRKVDVIWVSMDMDSVDKEYAPGVGMPNDGGLTRHEVLSLAQYIGKTCNLVGLDVVEMLPARDIEGKTTGLALELVARFLGGEYSWYTNRMDEYRRTNVTNANEKRERIRINARRNRS